MTTMLSEVYDALRDAQGVTDEKARRAAEAISAYDNRFADIKGEIGGLRGEFSGLKVEFADLRGEVRMLRWMTGTTLALVVAVLLKLFIH